MAKKILSVSLIDDAFHYLEIEKQPAGFFVHPPPLFVTQETLKAACQKADEIYLNGIFPNTIYEWGLFPKVNRRYLTNLVEKDAREKFGTSSPLQVQFKTLREAVEAGISKWEVAYIAVEEQTLSSLWKTFKSFTRKIKFIAPLPVALASTVAHTDQPAENFSVLWVGETSSVVTISSPEGIVKVARSVPLGLSRKELPESADYLKQFSQELGREISRTFTFFKQQFREVVPNSLYIFGNNFLPEIFQKFPLPFTASNLHYHLAALPVKGMKEDDANANIHLIGNLFVPETFNFLPKEELAGRKTSLTYRIAYAAVILLIALGVFLGVSLTALKSARVKEYNQKLSQLSGVQEEVHELRGNVSRLRHLEGWKIFYEIIYKNQPQWNMLLSELGLLIPPNVVIEDFQVLPEKESRTIAWNSKISGKIKAQNWQEGLNILREFGGKLQASPFFEVADLNYAPQKMGSEAKTFDFQISTTIKPGER